jgi:purine-binding chemotaxis protein CheW
MSDSPLVLTRDSAAERGLLSAETRPWCTFRLDEDLFGLDVLLIREVALPVPITPVPHAPRGVLGCVNLRGQIHLVLDLRRLLGRGTTTLTPSCRLILFKAELGDPFGVLVEEIGDIVQVPIEHVSGGADALDADQERTHREDLETGRRSPEEALVRGVARLHDELLLLLDARRLLPSLSHSREDGEVGA